MKGRRTEMEALDRNLSSTDITLIDATELDDEQFNDLISTIDPRGSLFPILCAVALILTTLAIIA